MESSSIATADLSRLTDDEDVVTPMQFMNERAPEPMLEPAARGRPNRRSKSSTASSRSAKKSSSPRGLTKRRRC